MGMHQKSRHSCKAVVSTEIGNLPYTVAEHQRTIERTLGALGSGLEGHGGALDPQVLGALARTLP